MTTAIDLSQLTPPEAIAPVDYETTLSELLTTLRTYSPDYDNLLESDPAYAVTEVIAYLDTLIAIRYNDKVKAMLLAYATGANLDHIAATYYGLTRPVITPADPEAVPPTEAVLMSDAEFRALCQLAPEGYSVAGPAGAYKFHALQADSSIKDVGVSRPVAGRVQVNLLSRDGDGTANATQIANVTAALNDEMIRPLNDAVVVQSATVTPYAINVKLYLPEGPSPAVVAEEAEKEVTALAASLHKVFTEVPVSAITAAAHVAGVQRVEVISPASDLQQLEGVAYYASSITVTTEVLS